MDIWCIGDINYLASVLNGLAMLNNYGLFNDLIRLGLIIAVILILFQNVYQTGGSGGIPWGQFIVAFIAFQFLFGSVTTVHINDTYTLKSRDVDNVPYGIAVTGSILSKVAHEITEKLEQAFSLPSMMESGFAGPLETLAKGRSFITGLDTLHKGKITRTLVEYADKCTSTGINKGELDINQIKVAADPWSAMKWTSDIYYAMTWLPTDPEAGTLRTCTDAWGAIDNYLRGQLWSDWNKFLSSQICNAGEGTCDPLSTVQAALDSLVNTEQSAQDYMIAAVLLPVFEQGQIEFNSFMGKPEMAVIVGQAREQRNIQWQAEGSLFMNIARPMMAFFEGFLYAITPFMALLVAFVPWGLSLVGKYFLMFLWVQLWMPIMAILHHYTQVVAQQKLAVLIDGSIPLTSLQGHLMGASAINDWLGTAGVLVASTPAISLALLFGGAITMTHLAGRLQHGDFVNEKIAAPDVVQPGAVMAMAPGFQHDGTLGTRMTGAEGAVPRLEVSEISSRAVQSSEAQLATAQQTFRDSVGQMAAHGAMGSHGFSSQLQSAQGVDARSGTQVSSISAFSQVMGKDLGLSQTETERTAGILSGAVSAGVSAGVTAYGDASIGGKILGTGAKAGVRGEASSKVNASVQAQLQKELGTQKSQQVMDYLRSHFDKSDTRSLQTAMEDKMSSMASSGQLSQYQDVFRQEDISNVEKAAQQVQQAQKQYSETEQFASRIGMGQSVSLLAAGRSAADGSMGMSSQEFMSQNQLWLTPGAVDQAASKYRHLNGVTNEEQARWMGIFETMHRMSKNPGGHPGDTARSETAGKMLLGGMQKMGLLAPDTGDATKFKGVVDYGKLERAGEGAARAAEGIQGPGQVSHRIQGIRRKLPGVEGREAVRNWHDDKLGEFIDQTAQKHGVDPNLVRAVMQAESRGKPGAFSPKGAMGMMQLMPGTAKDMGVKNPWNPKENIEGGTKYLREQLSRFGDVPRALAAYNWGPENVAKGGRLPQETQNFVTNVMKNYRGNRGG